MYYSYNFSCIGNVLGIILKIISGLLFNFIIHSACLSGRIKIFFRGGPWFGLESIKLGSCNVLVSDSMVY